MPPPQVLEKIRAEIIESGRDTRYHLYAYLFVLNGLEFYLMKIGEKRHVSGQELARGLVDFSTKQFGPLAYQVLTHWGVHRTDDFGYIVYNLIDIGLMSKQESDRLGDFFDVVSLRRYCEKQNHFVIDRDFIKSVRGA